MPVSPYRTVSARGSPFHRDQRKPGRFIPPIHDGTPSLVASRGPGEAEADATPDHHHHTAKYPAFAGSQRRMVPPDGSRPRVGWASLRAFPRYGARLHAVLGEQQPTIPRPRGVGPGRPRMADTPLPRPPTPVPATPGAPPAGPFTPQVPTSFGCAASHRDETMDPRGRRHEHARR